MKRFLVNALVVVLMMTMIVVSVSADNSEDTEFAYFRIVANDFSLLEEKRAKENDTSVYLYLEPILDFQAGVRVATFGFDPVLNSLYNETISYGQSVPYVTCFKGIEYGIHNFIYENGRPLAVLGFMTTGTTTTATVSGKWSPDSVGALTIAH